MPSGGSHPVADAAALSGLLPVDTRHRLYMPRRLPAGAVGGGIHAGSAVPGQPLGRAGSTPIRRLTVLCGERRGGDLIARPEDLWVSTGDGWGQAIPLDPLTGRRLITLDTGGASGLVAAPDSSWLAFHPPESREQVRLVDARTGRLRAEVIGCLPAAAADGSRLAVADTDGEIRLHDTADGRLRWVVRAHWPRSPHCSSGRTGPGWPARVRTARSGSRRRAPDADSAAGLFPS